MTGIHTYKCLCEIVRAIVKQPDAESEADINIYTPGQPAVDSVCCVEANGCS